MKAKWLLLFSSYSIGIIFILSGVGKIVNTGAFAYLIISYGFGYLGLLAPLIAVFEVFAGISLIINFKPKIIPIVLIVSTVIFTMIYTYGLIFLNITSCNCFGRFSIVEMDGPLFLYIKNFAIVLLSFFVFKLNNDISDLIENYKSAIVSIVVLFATFFAGYSFNIPKEIRLIDQTKFEISNTSIDFLNSCFQFHSDSTYLVFVFSYSCPHCINSIENVKQFKEKGIVDKILYVGFGDGVQKDEFLLTHNIRYGFVEQDLNWIRLLNLDFPTTYFVKDKIPYYAYKGFVEYPYLFLKHNSNLQPNSIPNIQN